MGGAEIKLRTIILTLAALSFLSTAIGGYLYYSSSKDYVYRDAYERAGVTIRIAANRVASKLEEHQKAVRTLAGLKELRTAAAKKDPVSIADANLILDHFNSSMVVDVCYLMDQRGDTIASSNRNDPDSFVGQNYAFRPYFTQAVLGHHSIYMALGVTSKKRGIYDSYPVYGLGRNSAIGVVVMKTPVEHIEEGMKQVAEGTLLLTGPHGVIFATNREDWLYHVLWKVPDDEINLISESKQFGDGPWDWTGMKRTGADRATDSKGVTYRVHEIKISSYPGWKVVYIWTFKNVADKLMVPVFRTAGNIIFALCIIIGLAVLVLYKKASRDITARKEADVRLEKAYGELEDRVRERTADLENSNEQLKNEINERNRAEAALINSEAEFKNLSQEFNALLNAIPDHLTLQSSDFKVLWANRTAAARLGKEHDDLKGKYCYSLWYNSDGPCKPCPLKRAFKTGNVENDVLRTRRGSIWDIRAVPIKDDQGTVVKVITLGRDITERRKLEEQLLHAQKMEAVGQLAGGVAHEFNNILTAIINNVYLAQRSTEGGGPARDNLDNVLKLSNNAAVIARDLLAFSRKQYVELSPLKLNDVVKGAERLLKNFIGEDVEIRVLLTDKEPTILADRHQIEQVIINLATNARDAMPGGGSLTIETDIREMDDQFVNTQGFGSPGTYVLLSITDTGEGTTFNIYLPEIKSAVPGEKPAFPFTSGGKAESILVAEDEAEVRGSIRSVLEESGYRVIEAVDGKDAVDQFVRHADNIDVVIMDVIMPKMNGKEAYEEIRRIKPDIKVIFTSGYTADIIREKKIIDGDLVFVSKPIFPNKLLSKIREVLEG